MDHVLLLDMAIHGFDAMRCMTGLTASTVYCQEWNPANSWYRQGSSAAAIFELENGAVFVYRGSWCAAGLGTSWECAWRFVGAKGALAWDGADQIRIEVVGGGARDGLFDAVSPSNRRRSRRKTVSTATLACSLTSSPPSVRRSEPETVGHDNIRSLAMVIGAIDSAEAGRRVDIVM